MSIKPKFSFCYWCGSKEHDAEHCSKLKDAKLEKCFRKLADELVEGDFIGTLRGEVAICLNVIYYYKALGHAVEEICTKEQVRQIRDRAFAIRSEKYGRLPW